MRISLFRGKEANEVAYACDIGLATWDSLGSFVTQYPWAPGLYKKHHRTNVNLESMDLFVCDIDGGCTIEEAKRIFAPYQCMIGLSKSHQIWKGDKAPCDRFRVIIPLQQPITNDRDFKATWFAVQKLCPAMDPSCKDSARFYWPCTDIITVWDGAPMPVTLYVAPEPKPTPLIDTSRQKLDLSKRTYRFKADGAPEGQWHAELVAACMDIKQQRWTQDEATSWLADITGELDSHDLGVIEDVWLNRDPRHPARENHDEALVAVIRKCHLIRDTRPGKAYCFLDRATGETHNIDMSRVPDILGDKGWKAYVKTNIINAEFTFDPRLQPITPKNNNTLYYNTYRPAPWRHDEYWFAKPVAKLAALPEIFERFFVHLTADHGPSKEYLLDWMAHSLKTRNFTILTAIGNQGVGKGILAEMLKHLHGEPNYCQPKDDVFKERFNAPLKNKTMVNVDEISLRTKEEHDRLKAVVNDWIDIEEKGRDAINCRNYANFYISSNHLDAIQVEPGDRRYSIIQLAATKLIETELRNHISYLTDPKAIADLGAYLLYRPVSHDMLQPFRSPRFEEVRLAGLNDWELFMIEEFCVQHSGRTYAIQFVLDEIKNALEMRALGRRRLVELQKRFPEKFKIIQDPKDRGKRLVAIS